MRKKVRRRTGIRVRHRRPCESHGGGKCTCRPGYEAYVYVARDRRKTTKTFSTLAAAKTWLAEAERLVRRGALRAPTRTTFREAAEAWLEDAEAGVIRNRSGDVYKPSSLRGYRGALSLHVLPCIGGLRLSHIDRVVLQDLADRLIADNLDPSTVRNALMPVRVIFKRAVARGVVAVDPTIRLELPAVRGARDRVVSPREAEGMLATLAPSDRALWATAFFAGLRLGELRALQWSEVDLAAGVIRVVKSWDPRVGFIEPKSRAGRRQVPVPAVLRDHLVEHGMTTKCREGFVFGRVADRPFDPSAVGDRAKKRWTDAGFPRLTLHEARHTFASLMIAAGVNAKALSTYMGHSSVLITLDRYGHLMPGNEAEAAMRLDAYLERSITEATQED